MPPDQITVRQAARLLGVSTRTTYTMLRAGDIPATQWRGRWIISRTAVHQKLQSLGLEVVA